METAEERSRRSADLVTALLLCVLQVYPIIIHSIWSQAGWASMTRFGTSHALPVTHLAGMNLSGRSWFLRKCTEPSLCMHACLQTSQ